MRIYSNFFKVDEDLAVDPFSKKKKNGRKCPQIKSKYPRKALEGNLNPRYSFLSNSEIRLVGHLAPGNSHPHYAFPLQSFRNRILIVQEEGEVGNINEQ